MNLLSLKVNIHNYTLNSILLSLLNPDAINILMVCKVDKIEMSEILIIKGRFRYSNIYLILLVIIICFKFT